MDGFLTVMKDVNDKVWDHKILSCPRVSIAIVVYLNKPPPIAFTKYSIKTEKLLHF